MMKTLELRRKQIDSLKVFNENVIERKFNEIYEVDFTLKLGKSKIEAKIIIFLPQKFPEDEKPKLFVQPALAHNYLNKHGEVVNFPGLSNFTVHSEIGRIANVLISDFQKNPPALLATSQQNSSIFHDFDLRKELDGLAVDQLQDLLRDPVYFDDFVEETRIVKSHNNALEALFDEVEILSRANLNHEETLTNLNQRVQELTTTFLQLGEKFEVSRKEYDKKSENLSPTNIKEHLSIATSDKEIEIETLVQDFLQDGGSINLPTFLNDFLEKRKLYAMRKFKEDRLAYQLQQLRLQ